MGKNINMLKTYRQVLKGNNEAINIILPNMYAKDFYNVDYDYLLEKGINNLIIDIDGTILPADDIKVPKQLIDKIEELKRKKFSICLVSNNYKRRVEPVAKVLKVDYLHNANKPLPICFDKALEILKEKDIKKVAVIGDQMLTDIKGANCYQLYSVLVNPISKHNNIGTYTNRKLQNRIERYLKHKNIFDKEKYYKN